MPSLTCALPCALPGNPTCTLPCSPPWTLMRTWVYRSPLLWTALALLGAAAPAQAQMNSPESALAANLDAVARAHAERPGVVGLSVAVVRAGEPLLVRGYGKVNLEWNVDTPRDASAVYEIGSITKQFTVAAILQLADAGEIDLDADLTTYLPDYQTGGRFISVRRLIDHTSGIRSYTEMPAFGELSVRRLPRDTLVALVQAEPLDFEPGTALIYNNSGYFLLGLILERVTGQRYESYLAEHIFGPLGMRDSHYCSETAVRERRAHGYATTPGGIVRAAYLDHTWPYAAGSLCSSVEDLSRWNQALHRGGFLSESAYQTMITPLPLEDGTPTRYAGGLMLSGEGRHRSIAHGGGINGFLSDGRYYPEDDLVIVVLQNSTGPQGPGLLGAALAEAVLGAPPALEGIPYTGALSDLVGTYTGPARGQPLSLDVTVDDADGALVLTPSNAQASMRPVYLGEGIWAAGSTRIRFAAQSDGARQVTLDQGSGIYRLVRP
jgi:CubicO group peptidase (beta-lactamase class C family)